MVLIRPLILARYQDIMTFVPLNNPARLSVHSSMSSKSSIPYLPKPRLLNRQRRQPKSRRPIAATVPDPISTPMPVGNNDSTTAPTTPNIPKPTHSPRNRKPAAPASTSGPNFFRTRSLPVPLMVVSWTWEMVSDENTVVVVVVVAARMSLLMMLMISYGRRSCC